MLLPYIARAICLALCSAGVLQVTFELAAWAAWPILPQTDRGTRERRTERLLFALTLAVRLSPWLLALAFLVPAYLAAEDNHAAERVSLASIGFAVCVLLWAFVGLLRVVRAVNAGRRCIRRSEPAARESVRLYPDHPSLIAVAGIFRTTILISRTLLDESRFSAATLDVALAHERAHMRQRDNLKNLLLTLLPHIAFSTAARPSLDQRWRLAAEMAADEEGTGGRSDRSLLLAGMLVSLAREATQPTPYGLTALNAHSEHLRLRVERLLERVPSATPPALQPRRSSDAATTSLVAAGTLLLATLCALALLEGHRAAELLFHGA